MNKSQPPPILHGRDHRPGGADPLRPGPWIYVGGVDGPPFVTGSNMTATMDVPNPMPMRFRLAVGPPNIIRSGTITVYFDHQIEIQGDVTGVSPGDTVFVIPMEYRHEFDVPVQAHDDFGTYVPCRLYSTGEFVYGDVGSGVDGGSA